MPYVSSTPNAGLRAGRQRFAGAPIDSASDDLDPLPRGRAYTESIDWVRLGVFGLGIALGALVGSGTALLFAPQSGDEMRDRIRRRAKRLRGDARDAWDELRDELEWAAHRATTRVRRGATKGRWAAEDMVDQGRRKLGL